MTFRETLDSGKFVVTAEVGPPKGTDIHEMLRNIQRLKGKVDAANVTDNQSAVMRICSLAVCKIALEQGLEPILQMTCRDRNTIRPSGRSYPRHQKCPLHDGRPRGSG
jgi:methylenetetrahydrofolate reductase (NADPH)